MMQANISDYRDLADVLFRMVRNAKRGMSQRFDVQRYASLCAARGDGIRLSDLAQELDVNPSSVTRSMRDLVDEGLVEMSENPADKRSSLVTLTPRGESACAAFQDGGARAMAQVLADWDRKDVCQFHALLVRFVDAWKSAPAGPLGVECVAEAGPAGAAFEQAGQKRL